MKRPECLLFAGALNHADLDAIVERVGSMPWRHPEALQLLLMDQEQSYFRLWTFRRGRLVQVVPEGSGEDDVVS